MSWRSNNTLVQPSRAASRIRLPAVTWMTHFLVFAWILREARSTFKMGGCASGSVHQCKVQARWPESRVVDRGSACQGSGLGKVFLNHSLYDGPKLCAMGSGVSFYSNVYLTLQMKHTHVSIRTGASCGDSEPMLWRCGVSATVQHGGHVCWAGCSLSVIGGACQGHDKLMSICRIVGEHVSIASVFWGCDAIGHERSSSSRKNWSVLRNNSLAQLSRGLIFRIIGNFTPGSRRAHDQAQLADLESTQNRWHCLEGASKTVWNIKPQQTCFSRASSKNAKRENGKTIPNVRFWHGKGTTPIIYADVSGICAVDSPHPGAQM
jgi:hypothetical protein